MDPEPFKLHDISQNSGEEPGLAANFSRRASQEELHFPELLEAYEILNRAGPPEPGLVMDEPVSPRASTTGQFLWRRARPDQRPPAMPWARGDSNQHLIPSLSAPIEPQIQAQASTSFLGVPPTPFQTLAPVARPQPVLTPLVQEVILTPCTPQHSHWPVASMPDSRFGFSPCTLVHVSTPIAYWHSPYFPPNSLVVLPEVRPSWSWCPETVPVHQPCCPDLVSRNSDQQDLNVKPESAASEKEHNEEEDKAEDLSGDQLERPVPLVGNHCNLSVYKADEQQETKTPEKDKPQANNTDNTAPKSEVSPGSLPSQDEESLVELFFEEYKTIMDSLSLENPWGVEAKENEQCEDKEKLEKVNGSFVEYLKDLCSDEDFVENTESTLNSYFLDSLVSADPDPTDRLPLRELQQEPLEVILQQHLHPPPADSSSVTPVTGETSPSTSHVEARAQSPILDAPGSQSDLNPNHDAPLSTSIVGSTEGWTTSSPLPSDAIQKYYNSVDAMSPLYYDGSIFKDYSLDLILQPLANIFPDTSITSDFEAGDIDALVEELEAMFPTEEASQSPSNLADTQSAQMSQKLQDGPLLGDPWASESPSTSGVSGSNEEPQATVTKDPEPSFQADLLTLSPPQSAQTSQKLQEGPSPGDPPASESASNLADTKSAQMSQKFQEGLPPGDAPVSESPSNLADTQSAQTSQKLQDGPLLGDPWASESPSISGVSGSNEEPQATVTKDPEPSFQADLLTLSPPQSAQTSQKLQEGPSPGDPPASESASNLADTKSAQMSQKFQEGLPPGDAPVSESTSNLADSQSAQMSQKLQEGPLPGDPPASESPSTSNISGSTEDPQAITAKDPESSFRADLLTINPPQSSAGPPKTLHPPPAQKKEPEEQGSPKSIKPNPSRLEDYAVPVPANSSFVADSHADDGNSSDRIPEKLTAESQKEPQVSEEFPSSELRPGDWGETERQCETNLGKGGGKQTVRKAREGMAKQRKENKEDETKVKQMRNTRHSQRLSGQIEKEKVSEKSIKETTKVTPERDRVISENQNRGSSGGEQLPKREERQATKTANTAEQFPEIGQKEQQKLAGEMQKLKAEGGERPKNPNMSTEIGAENAPLTKMAQEEKELGEGRVETKEEEVQMSSFVSRRTRSTSTEPTPLPDARARGKIKHSKESKPQTLSGSSPMKRTRSPRVQRDILSTNDSIKESTMEKPPQEINEPPFGKTCEEIPNVKPKLTVDGQAEREGQHAEVTGTQTWDFYSLRSLNVPKRTANTREATHHQCSPKPSPGKTEDVKGEDDEAERPGLIMLSPMKRDRHGLGASEETETRVNETDEREMQEEAVTDPQTLPVSSPMKRRTRSPRVQRDILSINYSIKESPGEEPPDKTNETPSRKTFEENPKLTVDGQAERLDQHGEVTGTQTWDFYSLRFLNVPKRMVNTREATHHQCSPKPSPDQTEDAKAEDEVAERPGLIMLSPMKRDRHGLGAPEETETRVNETDVISVSPTKRGRWKRKAEVNSEQKLTGKVIDEVETSGPPSTGKNKKVDDKNISSSAGRGTFGSAMETRLRRKEARIACTRQTRLSQKLPTKYKDFIKGGKGKTPRGRRKM